MHSVDIWANPAGSSVDLDLTVNSFVIYVAAPKATATGVAHAAVVTGQKLGTAQAVRATATGVAYVPLVSGSNSPVLAPTKATATGVAKVPVVTGGATVAATVATATGLAKVPVLNQTAANATVTALVATSTGVAPAEVVSGEVVLSGGGPASASGFASVAVVSAGSPPAVTFDAVGAGAAANGPTGGIITWSHTTSGSGRLVIVALALGEPTPNGDYNAWTRGVKYGGTDMQPFVAQFSNNLLVGFVELYSLFLAPGVLTGAQTITTAATHATAGTPNTLIGASVSYNGAVSINGLAGSAGGGANPSITVASQANSKVLAAFCGGAALATPSNTQRYLNNFNAAGDAGNLMVQEAPGATSVTITAALADLWGGVGCSIDPI